MRPALKELTCQVCGTKIPQGGVFYTARTEIISGSDGILPDVEEVSADAIIEEALGQLNKVKSEEDVMDDVYQEIKLTLCGRCRLVFRDRVLDMIKF